MNGNNGTAPSAIEKLVSNNYNYWKLCMEAYLQGQDLWELVSGADMVIPEDTPQNVELRRKWNIKSGKALFALRTSISKEYIEHVRDVASPKQVWETLDRLFTQKNTMRLQFLENELAGLVQGNLSISEYFLKVKHLCYEVSALDTDEPIRDGRLRRYLIRGLRKEFMPFISSVQGWPVQPSIIELGNLLSNQEALVKQMSSRNHSQGGDVLYTQDQGNSCFPSKHASGSGNQFRPEEETKGRPMYCYRCGKEGHLKRECRVKLICTRCGKPGHIKKNCRVKLDAEDANVVHDSKVADEPNWEQCFSIEVLNGQENIASAVHNTDASVKAIDCIDYKQEWIVD